MVLQQRRARPKKITLWIVVIILGLCLWAIISSVVFTRIIITTMGGVGHDGDDNDDGNAEKKMNHISQVLYSEIRNNTAEDEDYDDSTSRIMIQDVVDPMTAERGVRVRGVSKNQEKQTSIEIIVPIISSITGTKPNGEETNINTIQTKVKTHLQYQVEKQSIGMGPLLFNNSNGWNGTSYEEGVAFCNQNANERSICPWKAYCPRGDRIHPRIQQQQQQQQSNNHNERTEEVWAPVASIGQAVWVNVGSVYPCMQRGQLNNESMNKSQRKYILCCHEGEEENVMEEEVVIPDLAAIVNQTELFLENTKCMKRCHYESNKTDTTSEDARSSSISSIVIIPSSPKRYCLARCRWLHRQNAIARLANYTKTQTYDPIMTTSSPLIEGRCDDITNLLLYDGICKSIAHRQKPYINLVLSSKSWLGREINLGLRDCAASRCHVTTGPGHDSNSHLYAGTVQKGAHPATIRKEVHKSNGTTAQINQINVMVQPESLANTDNNGKRRPMQPTRNVDWIASHRRDEFPPNSWIPYSQINTDQHHFRIRGKPHHQRRVAIPVFIKNCDPKSVHSDRAHRIAKLGKALELEGKKKGNSLGIISMEQFGKCDLVGTVKRKRVEDSYPECGGMMRRSAMWDAQKECVFFHSMFALVIENTFEEKYMTEKIYQPLKMGTVPIVMGNSSLYRRHLPDPQSVVFLDDFDTYEAAATYLRTLAQNSSLWEKHLAWKERAFSDDFSTLASHSFATLPCDLCDKYAEEVFPNSECAWDRNLGLSEILDPCVVEILSRHTLPNDNLPLVNPALGFDAVLITHYTPLRVRKPVMIERVRQTLGVDPIFIEDFDREVLTDEDVKCFGNAEAQMAYIQRVAQKGEVSLTMKHFTAYYYMIQHSLDNVLVLEDDAAFLQADWISKDYDWQKILKDLPASYDLLILSAFGNVHNRGEKITEHIYLAQQSRVASMYMISQKGARNMLRSLPMVSVIDFQMNYAANHKGNQWMDQLPGFHGPRTVNIELYHSEPPQSKQIEPDGHKSTWKPE